MKKFAMTLIATSFVLLGACSKNDDGTVAYTVNIGNLDGIEKVIITVADLSAEEPVSGTTQASGTLAGLEDGVHTVMAEAYAVGGSSAAAAVSAEVEITETNRTALALLQFAAPEITGITASSKRPDTGEEITLTADVMGGGQPLLLWSDDCDGRFGTADGNSIKWTNDSAEECMVSVQAAGADTDATMTKVIVGMAKGTIKTLAGNGCLSNGNYYHYDWTAGGDQFLGGVWDENGMAIDDGVPATSVKFNKITGMDWDNEGRLMFADRLGGRIFRIEHDGTLTRLVGPRLPDDTYDNCWNDDAKDGGCTSHIADIVFDKTSGKLFYSEIYDENGVNIVDLQNNVDHEIWDADNYVTGLALNRRGDLFVGQSWNTDIVKIFYNDYAVPETDSVDDEVSMDNPANNDGGGWDVEVYNDEVYYTNRHDNQIYKITLDGEHVIVGGRWDSQDPGFAGDGGPATEATISEPRGMFIKDNGDIYFSDSGNERIRKISNGVMSTVLENVGVVWDLTFDQDDNMIISGHSFCEVRKVYGPY